ncbi:hypothetical protein M3J09_006247 [Ascochyta lentis]
MDFTQDPRVLAKLFRCSVAPSKKTCSRRETGTWEVSSCTRSVGMLEHGELS